MSYQVLARKWRPRLFSQMVGQEHVLRVLINALDKDRLHHAFLFTGTRGVGKTTLARILAKSLNCETGVSSKPCGQCSACREIDEGRFIDLLELDAATNTGIDNMREVLDNAQYVPTRGRYKVYLIDEVHMLSKAAFNSMLKTLEEPPPYVKFILATTDPQKIPITVLSRCLQFNLKHLSMGLIGGHLEFILKEEGIEYDSSAVLAIARAADGSMRDALSLLDQAIAYGAGALRGAEVTAMLGAIERDHIHDLLAALAANDAAAVMKRVCLLAEQAPNFTAVLDELLSCLHRIALAQILPDAVDNTLSDRDIILTLARTITPEDVQLFYQIGLMGQRDLPLASDAHSGFEMILLRMLTFRPVSTTRYQAMSQPDDKPRQTPLQPVPQAVVKVTPQPTLQQSSGDWHEIVAALNINGLARELALNCELEKRSENRFQLVLDPAHAQARSKGAEQRLQQALQQYFSMPIEIAISVGATQQATPARLQARARDERREAAVQAIRQDPVVKSLCETFNAQLDADSIQAID